MVFHAAVPEDVTYILSRSSQEPAGEKLCCHPTHKRSLRSFPVALQGRQMLGGPRAAPPPPRLTLSPGLMPCCLPYSIDGGLVRVGDQLECGIGRGQGEHAGVQGLLRECIVGGIKFAWHHVHRYGSLEGTRQKELIGLKKPHLLLWPPYPPFPVQQLGFHLPASPQAAYTQLQQDLIQHFDCLHAGCLGLLGEVLGLGEEAPSEALIRGTPRARQGPWL